MFQGDVRHTGVYETEAVHHLGTVQWRAETEGPLRGGPAVVGDVVYVGSGDGSVYALDRQDGTERWRFKTGGAVQCTPAVADGTVFFTSRDRNLYAVDAATGEERWRFGTGDLLSFAWAFDYYLSSPVVHEGVVYVGAGDGHLYAVDAQTGDQRWAFQTGGRVRTSPAIAGGVAYVGSMNGRLFAIDLETGEPVWTFATEGASLDAADFGYDRTAILSSPTVAERLVVFGGRDGFVYAVDQQTGQQVWRQQQSNTSWAISSPAITETTVFMGTSDGRFFHALDLETGDELWRFDTEGVVWSSPAVADGVVYFADTAGDLFAVDSQTGAEKWRFQTREAIWSSPVVADGIVYAGSDDGAVYALAGATEPNPDYVEPERAVFWTDSTQTPIYGRVRDYFAGEGYQVLDASSLNQFLRDRVEDRAPSVVVLAVNAVPTSIVDDEAGTPLLRRYLDAGGKAVWLGQMPLASEDASTEPVVEHSLAERVLGVAFHDDLRGFGGFIGARVTDEGERWGLRGWWVGCCSVDPEEVTTVLAVDEYGKAAAWVKRFGGPDGTGYVRLGAVEKMLNDFAALRAVAEHGL